MGYAIASALLMIIVRLVPYIILATILQKSLSVSFTPGEMIGPVAGCVVLGAFGIWILVRMLCSLSA